MDINYKDVIDTILNKSDKYSYKLIHDKGTKVYLVEIDKPFIVRIAAGHEGKYKFDEELLECIHEVDNLTAKVLYWEVREINGEKLIVQVQTYLPGIALNKYPNNLEKEAIVESTYKLHQRLCKVSNQFSSLGIPSVDKIIEVMVGNATDCILKKEAIKLLENNRFKEIIVSNETFLCHGDLWPENILLEKKSDKAEVKFIDLDPVVYGPKDLQPAILFSSYFLLGSYLFNQLYEFDIDELIKLWPEELNKNDILLLMLIFPIVIGLSKEMQFKSENNYEEEGYNQSLAPLLYSVNYIWKQFDLI
ncbi:phosphotransferase [Mycoplasmatota bacterium WC44]